MPYVIHSSICNYHSNLNIIMILGQRACSAKRSMAVSSRTDEAMAPCFVAPMARESARAISKPLPVPFCSTETKHGKPRPFSWRERTEEPIILRVCHQLKGSMTQRNSMFMNLPWGDHHDILPKLELQQVEENIVSRSNDDCGVALHLR